MSKKISLSFIGVETSRQTVRIRIIILTIIMILMTAIPASAPVVVGYSVSGYVRTSDGAGISGVTVTANGTGLYSGYSKFDTTNSSGYYILRLQYGFDGSVTPSKSGYTFNPSSRTYSRLMEYRYDQDFTGYITTPPPPPIVQPPIVKTLPNTIGRIDDTYFPVLRGSIVDDGGEACQYRFRYKESGSSYSYTDWDGPATTGQLFGWAIFFLSPGARYNAQARNSAGESAWGNEEIVTEHPPTPCDLTEALDTTLSFTTGGNADWFCQTTTSYSDGDAAQSGNISHNQESWMQTMADGPGTLSFYWKVSSEGNYDFLEFYIDGVRQSRISGSVDWQQITYTVASGPHILVWRYIKDDSVSSGSDCGWVDKVEWIPWISSLSQALDTTLSFTTGGNADWFYQTNIFYSDGDAAQSGDISHNQKSWMNTMVDGPGTLSFYWKVSSEGNYDFLEFYIDGVRQSRISGSVDWQQKTYAISSGSHNLLWRYIKDGHLSSGSDCGWVDKVEWAPDEPPYESLSEALDTTLDFATGGNADWFGQTATSYYDGDAAQSGNISHNQESWMQTAVNGPATLSFYWKVSSEPRSPLSSEPGYDFLEFCINGSRRDWISGWWDWHQMTYSLPSGSHTLLWRYIKDSSVSFGSDCGWVDFLRVIP
ncbi:MAG: carboxypeptidase-like regulatory domain-containing protein [Sedimentisphaerales bacterium]|nr:carboxypeptidase-like regulatory domain-containing protein [Sedimentisphaerales bacterium]